MTGTAMVPGVIRDERQIAVPYYVYAFEKLRAPFEGEGICGRDGGFERIGLIVRPFGAIDHRAALDR
jgi:hypothetical protein